MRAAPGCCCGHPLFFADDPEHCVNTVEIPLRARDGHVLAVALADCGDVDPVAGHRWYLTKPSGSSKCGYAARTTRAPRHMIYMHRQVMGVTDRGLQVDHVNGNRLDNRRSNLRVVTLQENRQNVAGRGGASPHRNVFLYRPTGRWYAQVQQGGRRIHLGYFATDDEAAEAVRRWRAENLPFDNADRSVVA